MLQLLIDAKGRLKSRHFLSEMLKVATDEVIHDNHILSAVCPDNLPLYLMGGGGSTSFTVI